jgi:hypothetical protein
MFAEIRSDYPSGWSASGSLYRARPARRPPQGIAYHMGGAEAFVCTLAMLAMGGGRRLIARYDWLYGWKLT